MYKLDTIVYHGVQYAVECHFHASFCAIAIYMLHKCVLVMAALMHSDRCKRVLSVTCAREAVC